MAVDIRDKLWEAAFRVYYDVYYSEMLANKLVTRWQLVDEVTRVLVAITASTSAVSGWALWEKPNFKTIWALIAGFSAVLALVHTALSVPRKLKDWIDVGSQFLKLRLEFESLRDQMRSDAKFDINTTKAGIEGYRHRYGEIKAREPHDLLMALPELVWAISGDFIARGACR
jgi:hypothetical protein